MNRRPALSALVAGLLALVVAALLGSIPAGAMTVSDGSSATSSDARAAEAAAPSVPAPSREVSTPAPVSIPDPTPSAEPSSVAPTPTPSPTPTPTATGPPAAAPVNVWAPPGTTTDAAAVTVSGTGPFSSLRISVSQTKHLINQVIAVSWTGGTPTVPDTGSFALNYLQLMQCWGGPEGPDREQCQYGGLTGDSRGGSLASTRQVSLGSIVDPIETYKPSDALTQAYVPFRAVNGKVITGPENEFFDAYSTNEIPFARTRADGSGLEYLETQTTREAPGLGCGAPQVDPAGSVTGRSCWLVVVPRSDVESNGTKLDSLGSVSLKSSPLSASNWRYHVAVPLQFEPVGLFCPIGSSERPTAGQEQVAEAIGRWQPALCPQSGTIYGYSQVSDDLARSQLGSDSPGLVYVSRPLPTTQADPAHPAVYAPIALSGVTIAFDIESQSAIKAPPEVKRRDGTRLTELNLNARLVAKLLTQSYQLSVSPQADYLTGNPRDLTRDPEFLRLNPSFVPLLFPAIADLLVPANRSDASSTVWTWISQDAGARAFLAGEADPWGMKVNKNYLGAMLPLPDFPKNDPFCQKIDGQPDLCTFDAHPYAPDMHTAALAAGRGDELKRTYWDRTALPPAYKRSPIQLGGSKAMIVITDTASAERYGLQTARLLNTGGAFVAPTPESLRAGVAAMQPDDQGVLQPLTGAPAPAAYPLTTLTYAATVPGRLAPAARHDYAEMIRFAVGPGQASGVAVGQLPYGYAPLPAELTDAALAAADAIARRPRGSLTLPEPSPSLSPSQAPVSSTAPASTPPVTTGVQGRPVTGGGVAGPVAGGSTAPPTPVRTTPAPVPTAPLPQPASTPAAALTPAEPVGAVRLWPVALLLLGGAAAGVGPAMRWLASRAGR